MGAEKKTMLFWLAQPVNVVEDGSMLLKGDFSFQGPAQDGEIGRLFEIGKLFVFLFDLVLLQNGRKKPPQKKTTTRTHSAICVAGSNLRIWKPEIKWIVSQHLEIMCQKYPS